MEIEKVAVFGASCAMKEFEEITSSNLSTEEKTEWMKNNYTKFYAMAAEYLNKCEGVEENKIITLN